MGLTLKIKNHKFNKNKLEIWSSPESLIFYKT